jgi:hypothetical protein
MSETKHAPPLFNTGDLVRHRASGERAVVVRRIHLCGVHGHADHPHCDACDPVFSGRYAVARGFREAVVSVAENEIEKVEEAP